MKPNQIFKNMLIREKLVFIIMATSFAGLLLAFIASSVNYFVIFHKKQGKRLDMLAQIISDNSQAVLSFNDQGAAQELLSALKADPHIVGAAIYDKEGNAFAQYRDPDLPRIESNLINSMRQFYEGGFIHTYEPVILRNNLLGAVYLKSDMADLIGLIKKHLLFEILIIFVAVITTFILASRLQRTISKPIFDLTNLTKTVSREKNYSLRAEKQSDDELGELTERFNEMLSEIQKREEALIRSNDALVRTNLDLAETKAELASFNKELEKKVQERTAVAEERAHKLRELASAMTSVEQKERRRLAELLHDHLQQILVAVKIGLDQLKNQASEPGVKASLIRLNQLIDDSINMSRTLAVELSPPILQNTGLIPAVEWLKRWFKEKHNLDVTLKIDSSFQEVLPDIKIFIFDAVRELLFNVIKHSEVSNAQVKLTSIGRDMTVEVSDNGKGFNSDVIAKVDAGGFGLFNIQERVAMLGGRMEVSSAPGKGTRFILYLPAAAEMKANGSGQKELPHLQPKELLDDLRKQVRVLVVDDHKVLRQGVISVLQGYSKINVIGEAADGVEAVEKTANLNPDVVVMDINMPRMNGIEAIKKIKSQGIKTKIIALSIHPVEDMAETMYEAGADGYLCKSGPLDDLVATIQRVMLNSHN